MSAEAQNSILKILEEPPADSVIILTAPSSRAVLPTIASRAQKLEVLPVSLKEASTYLRRKYSNKDIKSAWNLSEGTTGLMIALLDDTQKHPLKDAVLDVKSLLGQDTFERLLTLDKLSKDKDVLALFLEATSRVLAALNRTSGATSKQILDCRKLVLNLQKQLVDNTNPRLIALSLGLNLNV